MDNILIPELWLAQRDAEIRNLVRKPSELYAINLDDCDYGEAFRYYLLFSDCAGFVSRVFPEIMQSGSFYNKYYWFVCFSMLYMRKHGYDAGLEQQQFKMVENQEDKIDLVMIDGLSKLAEQSIQLRARDARKG